MISIEEKINNALEKIRPFLHRDGGDILLVGFEDGVVYLKFLGACQDCNWQDDTIENGIEQILLDEVPEVIKIEIVNKK
ncbi:NifU family protein [Mycoplasma sp. SG1]|uniref:NifU family protein n=1 Tax=Mycoplasma sp. SG1 TaxID=2810348 RepID=UPI0020256597|nr:NifU family protein [Mycoplasma sp. SG1]URM52840.1 NifU family protein [Mycoplasma sp. SG1]